MKSQIRHIHGKRQDDTEYRYDALMFVCPGCENEKGEGGLHMLPISGDADGRDTWNFDGNLEAPTLNPSILTRRGDHPNDGRPPFVCHSFLREGVFEFLGDCTHQFAGKSVPLPDLYEWAIKDDSDADDKPVQE